MPDNPDTYNVVLLVEENLTADDAARVHSLHEGLDGPVAYHVLLPMVDGAARLQTAMGNLGAPDLVPSPSIVLDDIDPAEVIAEAKAESEDALATAVEVLQSTGSTATGTLVTGNPIDALAAKVSEVDGHKSLYSESFYDPETFDRLYDGANLAEVKRRYDPDDRLTTLYDKAVRKR